MCDLLCDSWLVTGWRAIEMVVPGATLGTTCEGWLLWEATFDPPWVVAGVVPTTTFPFFLFFLQRDLFSSGHSSCPCLARDMSKVLNHEWLWTIGLNANHESWIVNHEYSNSNWPITDFNHESQMTSIVNDYTDMHDAPKTNNEYHTRHKTGYPAKQSRITNHNRVNPWFVNHIIM